MYRISLVVIGALTTLIGTAAGWLALSYWAMPVSDLGVVYVVGVRMALTSDNVQEIADGRTPAIAFLRRSQSNSNKYVWQRSKIERPAGCLYRVTDPATGRTGRPASCPDRDRISLSDMQLYFAREPDGALRIAASEKPVKDATNVTNGALYEAEGEIGIGKSLDDAAWFKIEVDAEWLQVLDPPIPSNRGTDPDTMEGACTPAIRPAQRRPLVMAAMPATAARLCRVPPEKPAQKRTLNLVHFQNGPWQWTDWTSRLSCRAILEQLVTIRTAGDVAGCLGGTWGGWDRSDLRLAFFEITPSGEFAIIR